MGGLRVLAIVGGGILLYGMVASAIAKFKIPPPPMREPGQLERVDLEFRCAVCGAEITMKSTPQDEDVVAPRHCREEMLLVAGVG